MQQSHENTQTPRPILGTMTFGSRLDREEAASAIRLFFDSGGSELDTAYAYVKGRTEEILGEVLKPFPREAYRLATKANPRVKGHLRPAATREQLEASLRRLRTEYVDLFYLHFPDWNTPLETTLEGCARLHEEGKFRKFGLSNYPAWQVAHIHHLCARESWPLPRVYQGMYNGVTRAVEAELFPCIRELDIRFYAYNPLAGGLLTGRYSDYARQPFSGRFADSVRYAERYWKESYFVALDRVRETCEKAQIAVPDAALRWMVHDSAMARKNGDGIILGAGRLEHLKQNLDACLGSSLPTEVAEAFEKAWDITRPDCPNYAR